MVPDLSGATDVDVVEVLVKAGDSVEEGDSLIVLETDKASMEVPALRPVSLLRSILKMATPPTKVITCVIFRLLAQRLLHQQHLQRLL